MLDVNQIYLGDCLIEHEKIKSGSVDLILTDLPYGNMGMENTKHGMTNKVSWDDAIEPEKIYEIANRILRNNGKMILFSQEPYTIKLINKALPNIPFCYKAIWLKDHFANALNAKNAMLNYYEDILVFSKTHPKHDFEGIHPLRNYALKVREFTNYSRQGFFKLLGHGGNQHFLESNKKASQFVLCTEQRYNELIKVFGIDKMLGFKEYLELKEVDIKYREKLIKEMNEQYPSTFNLWEGNKYKGNVLRYKKDYNGYHPTQKPILLLEDLIKTFSNENDLIVDLTSGSGTTAIASLNTNRNYICIEKDEKYFDLSCERVKKHITPNHYSDLPLFKVMEENSRR